MTPFRRIVVGGGAVLVALRVMSPVYTCSRVFLGSGYRPNDIAVAPTIMHVLGIVAGVMAVYVLFPSPPRWAQTAAALVGIVLAGVFLLSRVFCR